MIDLRPIPLTTAPFLPTNQILQGGESKAIVGHGKGLKREGDGMELKRDIPWLNERDFTNSNPLTVRIVLYYEEPKGTKTERILEFELVNNLGTFRRMSLWGDNFNFLLDTFKNNPELWNGKQFRIQETKRSDGKNIRKFLL